MYDIIIVGSGLAASSFLDGLNTKNKKIAMISPSAKKKKNLIFNNYNYIKKNLPPRYYKKDFSPIAEYFTKNRIILDSKTSIFGVLDQGGVSEYWGGSCEFIEEKKLDFLNKSNKKIFTNILLNLYKNFNFTGKLRLSKKQIKNRIPSKIDNIFKKIILNCSNNSFNFFHNCNAENYKTKKILSPSSFFLKKKKEIEKINFFVSKIKKKKNYYLVFCENDKKKIILTTKKLVLGAGTISTTKLVCEMLNIRKLVKILHNPMLFGVFTLKEKTKLDNFSSSKLACKIFLNKSDKYSTVNFRSSNLLIKQKIFKNYFLMKNFFFQKFYNYFEKKFLFFNLYLDNKFSNIYMKLTSNNQIKITTKKKKNKFIKSELLKNSNYLYKHLIKNKIIYPFKLNLVPKIGHDNHYIGTIPINGKDKILSLNEKCHLKNYKNLIIIDGSAIPANYSKFPTGLIIANAKRIGLDN